MPIFIPAIAPKSVEDKSPPRYGTDSFESDSGNKTFVSTSAVGFGCSMKLSYDGELPSVAGEFMEFLSLIRYDDKINESIFPFSIPSTHALWRNVPEREYLESAWIMQPSLDEALWRMEKFSGFSTPIVGINRWNFTIRNVRN